MGPLLRGNYGGRRLVRPVVLAAALVLLCLLVAVVGAIDKRFEALVGRIAVLEEVLAGGGGVVYCGV